MFWVYLVILAYFFLAGSNIVDKILRTKYLRNSFALTGVFVLIIATFLSVKFPMFLKESINPKTFGIKLVAMGIIGTGMVLLYY